METRQETKRLVADLKNSIREVEKSVSRMKSSSEKDDSSLNNAVQKLSSLVSKASGKVLPKLKKEHKDYISDANGLSASARKIDDKSGQHLITQASKELKRQAKKHKQIIRELEEILKRAKSALSKAEISSAVNTVKSSGGDLESKTSGGSGGYSILPPQYNLSLFDSYLYDSPFAASNLRPPGYFDKMMGAEYYYQSTLSNQRPFGSSFFGYSPTYYGNVGSCCGVQGFF